MLDRDTTTARYTAIRLACDPPGYRDPVDHCLTCWANFRCEFNTIAEFVGEVIRRRKDWRPLSALIATRLEWEEAKW